MNKQFNILSLSGGGIRGIFTISVLAHIEDFLIERHALTGVDADNYSIAKHFDLICGTSIGGIIALGLANGLTARSIKKVMLKERLSIFPKKNTAYETVAKSWRPTYGVKPLEDVLHKLFNDNKIGALNKYVVIPAISLTNGQVRAFKTPHHTYLHSDYKLLIKDVALATSAAPTYFPIHTINGERFVDGGACRKLASVDGGNGSTILSQSRLVSCIYDASRHDGQ